MYGKSVPASSRMTKAFGVRAFERSSVYRQVVSGTVLFMAFSCKY